MAEMALTREERQIVSHLELPHLQQRVSAELQDYRAKNTAGHAWKCGEIRKKEGERRIYETLPFSAYEHGRQKFQTGYLRDY